MKHFFIAVSLLFISTSIIAQQSSTPANSFKPAALWLDNKGDTINAHGGGFIFHNQKYYWFGEHKIGGDEGNKAMVGVHCYSSKDLYNWQDEGIALPVVKGNDKHPIAQGCILERPKVIYNKKTKKFVMWFHLERKGQGYSSAETGVAISNKITGPYTFVRSTRANIKTWPINFTEEQKKLSVKDSELKYRSAEHYKAIADGLYLIRDFEKGQMSRDMTVYVDDDGKAYHIHSAEENFTLHISELTDDYTNFTGKYIRVFPSASNEAPAVFKHKGKYYMVSSGCTGWAPNAARSGVATSILGEWKELGNPCIGKDAKITFNSQSTYIIPYNEKQGKYILVNDRWQPKNAIDGRYIFLPIKIKEDKLELNWYDEWKLTDDLF